MTKFIRICGKIANLILMFLKQNWLNNYPSSFPSMPGLSNSRKGLTWQPGGNRNSLVPPELLNQNLHFTKWTFLQLLVDCPGWHDAAEPGGHSFIFMAEHLVIHLALWLGSFTCMSPFNSENHPLKQAFLVSEILSHACQKCH